MDHTENKPPLDQCGSSSAKVLSFVEDYFVRGASKPDEVLNYEEQIYADNVDYYKKPLQKSKVLDDKRRYLKRWPIRSYELRKESVVIHCDSATSTYSFTGQIDLSESNPSFAGAAGNTMLTVIVNLGIDIAHSGSMEITRESSAPYQSDTDGLRPGAVPPPESNPSAESAVTGAGELGPRGLIVGGKLIPLFGVGWITSPQTNLGKAVDNWIRGKNPLTCDAMPGNTYRCLTGSTTGEDVAEFALINGAAKAAADATPSYKNAETQAKQAGRGVWR